jgi:hypothetical protein
MADALLHTQVDWLHFGGACEQFLGGPPQQLHVELFFHQKTEDQDQPPY